MRRNFSKSLTAVAKRYIKNASRRPLLRTTFEENIPVWFLLKDTFEDLIIFEIQIIAHILHLLQ